MKKLYDAAEIQSVYYKTVEFDDETGEFHALKIGLIATHKCTLKCKLCAERTAYFKEKYNPTLDELKNQIDKLFEIFNYVLKFELTGGEALVRKDLPEILRYILRYKKQFGRLRLLSNGTIIPSDEVISAICEYGKQADVLIDDYGEDLSINALAAKEKLDKNNIRSIHRKQDKENLHFGGWVDFGDLTKKHTQEDAEQLFIKCLISSKIGGGICVCQHGRVSTCRVVEQCAEFSVADNKDEYINIFDTNTTIVEKQNKLLSLFNVKSYTACQYCNGFCEDSERFIPAQQL